MTVMLIFAPKLFSLHQMPIGMETYYIQANSVTFVANPDPDTLSPLYVIVRPRKNLFH